MGALLLAGYVAPVEYGEVSADLIVTATAHNVTTFGVGLYLVARREISREEVFLGT